MRRIKHIAINTQPKTKKWAPFTPWWGSSVVGGSIWKLVFANTQGVPQLISVSGRNGRHTQKYLFMSRFKKNLIWLIGWFEGSLQIFCARRMWHRASISSARDPFHRIKPFSVFIESYRHGTNNVWSGSISNAPFENLGER